MIRRRVLGLAGLLAALGSAALLRAARSERLPVAAPIVVDAAYLTRLDTLRSGEPVAAILVRRGLGWADVPAVLQAGAALNPRRVPAGQVFDFRYPLGDPRPDRVETRLDDNRILRVRRVAGTWRGDIERVDWTVAQLTVSGSIGSSLYDALHAALPDTLLRGGEVDRFISDLADDVFGWEIDFSRDVYPGDRFTLVFEQLTSALGDVRYGRLLAARIDTRGSENRAYVLADDQGRNRYYDARGVSLRRAFTKKPVAYLRISSRFASRRLHPVLGTWRAHRGTDFAARTGTEIHATGDGVVRFAGRNGGYGLMVTIRHAKGIETRYAHMSRIRSGMRPGVRVEQGQVIGYVGATGLANGPHVHYEFLKNGRQVDPQATDLGDGAPLPEARRAEFARVRTRYAPLLDPAADAPTGDGSD